MSGRFHKEPAVARLYGWFLMGWICVFVSVVSVSRCNMLRSFIEVISQDEVPALCHDVADESGKAPSPGQPVLDDRSDGCRCLTFQVIIALLPMPEPGLTASVEYQLLAGPIYIVMFACSGILLGRYSVMHGNPAW